jgi:hypothetical protein
MRMRMKRIKGLPVLRTGTDQQHDNFTVEDLHILKEQINEGFVPYWPNHRSVDLPIGRLTNARVDVDPTGEGVLRADLLVYSRRQYWSLKRIVDHSPPHASIDAEPDYNEVEVCISSNGAGEAIENIAAEFGRAVRCRKGRELLKSHDDYIVIVVGLSAAFLLAFVKRLGEKAADGFSEVAHKAWDAIAKSIARGSSRGPDKPLIDELVLRLDVGQRTVVDFVLPAGLGEDISREAMIRLRRRAGDPLGLLREKVRPKVVHMVYEWRDDPWRGGGWFVSYVLTNRDRVYIDKKIRRARVPVVDGDQFQLSVGISVVPPASSGSKPS